MIGLMINDIKTYLRLEKKRYIKALVYMMLCISLIFIKDGKMDHAIEFIFLFMIIVMFGMFSMSILSVSKDNVENTKYLLTMPIDIKTFILSKNLLSFLGQLILLILIELIYIFSGALPATHLNKFFSFIVGIILDLALSNLIFKRNHKKDPPDPEADSAIFSSIAESFKLIFIVPICLAFILFVMLYTCVGIIIKVIFSIAFYVFSVRTLEKDMKNQGKFLEEVDLEDYTR